MPDAHLADLQAQDLIPRGFGIFEIICEFFGGDVPEFVLRGELKPGNEIEFINRQSDRIGI